MVVNAKVESLESLGESRDRLASLLKIVKKQQRLHADVSTDDVAAFALTVIADRDEDYDVFPALQVFVYDFLRSLDTNSDIASRSRAEKASAGIGIDSVDWDDLKAALNSSEIDEDALRIQFGLTLLSKAVELAIVAGLGDSDPDWRVGMEALLNLYASVASIPFAMRKVYAVGDGNS